MATLGAALLKLGPRLGGHPTNGVTRSETPLVRKIWEGNPFPVSGDHQAALENCDKAVQYMPGDLDLQLKVSRL